MAESGNFLLCQGRAGVWGLHPLLKAFYLEAICISFTLTVTGRFENRTEQAVVNVSYVTVQKELDRKFGCSWHVVAGEEFGTQITYEVRAKPNQYLTRRGQKGVRIQIKYHGKCQTM